MWSQPKVEGPRPKETITAHQPTGRDTPRVILRLARGADAPSGESPPRSRPPRARDPRTHSPDQSIHAAGVRVKGESLPRRPSDTAWESYPGVVPPTLPVRPSLALYRSCAGRPVSTPWHCATHSCTASTSHPSKEDDGTIEKGTDVNPAPARDGAMTLDQWSASPPSPPPLCGHPRRCATIPGTATPSPAMWEPGTTRHRHTRCCASSGLSSAAPSS
jgi:hypothetical protein